MKIRLVSDHCVSGLQRRGTLVRLVSRPTVHFLWNSVFGDDHPVKITRSCERAERSEGLGFFQASKDSFSASGSGTADLHIDHYDTSLCNSNYTPNILTTHHKSSFPFPTIP